MTDGNKIATRGWIESTFKVRDFSKGQWVLGGISNSKCLDKFEIDNAYLGAIKIKEDAIDGHKLFKRDALSLNVSSVTSKSYQVQVHFYNSDGENYHEIGLFRYTTESNRVAVGSWFNPPDQEGDTKTSMQTLYPADWSTGDWKLGIYIDKANGAGTDWDNDDDIKVEVYSYYSDDLYSQWHTGNFKSGRYIYTGVDYNSFLMNSEFPHIKVLVYDE